MIQEEVDNMPWAQDKIVLVDKTPIVSLLSATNDLLEFLPPVWHSATFSLTLVYVNWGRAFPLLF